MEIINSIEIFPHILLSDFLRYFIAAGASYFLFWILFKKQWMNRLNGVILERNQCFRELRDLMRKKHPEIKQHGEEKGKPKKDKDT